MTTPETQIVTPDIEKARMFAELAHSNQTYNDDVPYTYHLHQVVAVLSRFGFTDSVIVCAGFLHDAIEDTNRSYNDIKRRFGEDVAELVYAVSSELGRNREDRNKKTYPKIKGNCRATILKLADRIANVEYGGATGGKTATYVKEFESFENGIRDRETETTQLTRMWDYLRRILGIAS